MDDLKRLILPTEFIKKYFMERHCTKKVLVYCFWNRNSIEILQLNCILHITGLNLVRNLRRLEMAQNNIKKIENLDWLTNLEYLDLIT